MTRRTLVLALAAAVALPAFAADERTALTLYRANNDGLFTSNDGGASDDGYAVVHERRTLALQRGAQDLALGGLPAALDTEALSLRFLDKGPRVLSQRLLMTQGADGALAALVGQPVDVLGTDGQVLASGPLMRASEGLLVVGQGQGGVLVRNYAAVRIAGGALPARGATLQVRVDAPAASQAPVQLDYPTSGLGWRGSYVATVADGDTCRLTLDSSASIANRSGRDWSHVSLKLIAGEATRAKSAGVMYAMRSAVAMDAMAPAPAAPPPPTQASLGDLRTFSLPQPIDLPDGSVTRVPLYDARTLSCERQALFEHGTRMYRGSPVLDRDAMITGDQSMPIRSSIRFKAFDTLPAGLVRVMTGDKDGNMELLGEGRLGDTPRDQMAWVDLGEAFDLRGRTERTRFDMDPSGHALDEGFRITLSNAGDAPRTVTVRETPWRWRAWTLASSSIKPSQNSPDGLEFKVQVPARGTATLDYTLRYTWTDADVRH
jgi:hypothetical protein